ncbi:MAG: SCO family protein [Gallionella sp.]
MHNVAIVATLDLDKERGPMRIKRRLGIAACSLLLVLGGNSGIVAAADEHQHQMDMPMDMPMDHSEHQMGMPMDQAQHENGMDHSGHEQHMAMMKKAGKFTRSVNTYVAPDVRMLDMNGTEVALQQELSGDKPVFLNFIFTTCTTICPVMSATFQQVQALLGKQRSKVRMVSISIDPEHDTPANLREYANKYNADSQWKLLTGTVEDGIEVEKAYGVYSGDKMNHQPVTFLKAKGSENTWVRLDGLVDASDILKEYKKLKSK